MLIRWPPFKKKLKSSVLLVLLCLLSVAGQRCLDGVVCRAQAAGVVVVVLLLLLLLQMGLGLGVRG